MHLIYALIVTIFLTTMTPPAPPQTPTATPAPTRAIAVFSSSDVESEDTLQAAADVIEARLVALDVVYAAVSTTHDDERMAVQVEIEPEALTPRVIELLTQPGYLEFVDVDALDPLEQTDALIWTMGQQARQGAQEMPEEALLDPETERPFKTILDGTEISSAEAMLEPTYGMWIVEITLSDDAGEIMREYSAAHIGEALGIVIDGKIITAPIINNAISSAIWLQGNFTEAEARELAAQLDGGPLPVPLEFAGFLMLAE